MDIGAVILTLGLLLIGLCLLFDTKAQAKRETDEQIIERRQREARAKALKTVNEAYELDHEGWV